MKLKIKITNGKTFDEAKEDIKSKLPKTLKDKVKFSSFRSGDTKVIGKIKIGINSEHIFDNCEMETFETLKTIEGYEIERLEKISKSFLDLHDIESRNPKNFPTTIERAKEEYKPLFIKKKSSNNENVWWIGAEKIDVDSVHDLRKLIKDIYCIGAGLGLHGRDVTVNLPE